MGWGDRGWGEADWGGSGATAPNGPVAAGARVRSGSATATVLSFVVATASGTRLRDGVIVLTVFVTCAGQRLRSHGLIAPPAVVGSATAGATRTRGGFCFAAVTGGGGGGGGGTPGIPGPTRRWRFDDPLTGDAYVWEINPNDGGSPDRKRTLTEQDTVAIDGKPVLFEGEEPIWQLALKGIILTKTHYEALALWLKKRHVVLLTDDLGRQMQVVGETFTPTRAFTSRYPYRHTYTATLRLFGYGTAAIVNPAPTLILA